MEISFSLGGLDLERFQENLVVGKCLLKMVAESEVVCLQQSVAVLDVNNYFGKGSKIEDIVTITSPVSPRAVNQVRISESVSTDLSTSQVVSFLVTSDFMILLSN